MARPHLRPVLQEVIRSQVPLTHPHQTGFVPLELRGACWGGAAVRLSCSSRDLRVQVLLRTGLGGGSAEALNPESRDPPRGL